VFKCSHDFKHEHICEESFFILLQLKKAKGPFSLVQNEKPKNGSLADECNFHLQLARIFSLCYILSLSSLSLPLSLSLSLSLSLPLSPCPTSLSFSLL
jgi:hypothetical protein